MSWIHNADPRWQRGAAAVEMAIIMPLLLLFIAGIVDFGRYFLTEIQLSNAAREGARAAIVSPADVTPRVLAAAPILDPSGSGVDVVFRSPSGAAVPACATDVSANVTAEVPDYEWILLEPALNFFGTAPGALPEATATAVMRCA